MPSFSTPSRFPRILYPVLFLVKAVDAALDAFKAASTRLVLNATTAYTLTATDFGYSGTTVVVTNGSACTATIPLDAATPGQSVRIVQGGAGQLTVSGANGVTVVGDGTPSARGQDVTALCIAANSYILTGT